MSISLGAPRGPSTDWYVAADVDFDAFLDGLDSFIAVVELSLTRLQACSHEVYNMYQSDLFNGAKAKLVALHETLNKATGRRRNFREFKSLKHQRIRPAPTPEGRYWYKPHTEVKMADIITKLEGTAHVARNQQAAASYLHDALKRLTMLHADIKAHTFK